MLNVRISNDEMMKRVIRSSDLVADKAAFIDAYTPGSDKKENYTIIGPGVSENPDMVINLEEKHGFNVGAAAMPNGCKNNLHLHKTAEVFIVYRGTWRFIWGNGGKDGEAILTAGDVISLPTWIFRGFENIGSDDGFLFSILGEDDPQKVIWDPQVLREAKDYGLVLLEDGRLINTKKGMKVPDDAKIVQPISDEKLEEIRKVSVEEMESRVFRFKERIPHQESYLDCRLPGCQKDSYGIIGPGIANASDRPSLVNNPHSFSLEAIETDPGNGLESFKYDRPQVILAFRGKWKVEWGDENVQDGEVILDEKDLMSIPEGTFRKITNVSNEKGFLYIISGGDVYQPVEWAPQIKELARKNGLELDGNGRLIALK